MKVWRSGILSHVLGFKMLLHTSNTWWQGLEGEIIVIANSRGCREARVCSMQVSMLQSWSKSLFIFSPLCLCESCLPHSIQTAWIRHCCCFMWCKLVCGTSQKIHVIPCYSGSTIRLTSPWCEVCALPLLFGCLKAGKLDQCFMQAQTIGYFSPMDADI